MTARTLDAPLRALRRRIERGKVAAAMMPAAAQRAARNGLSVAAIAEALGISRMHAHRLVHGRGDR